MARRQFSSSATEPSTDGVLNQLPAGRRWQKIRLQPPRPSSRTLCLYFPRRMPRSTSRLIHSRNVTRLDYPQILDGGTGGAGKRSDVIGHITLHDHDLRFPAAGPRCMVIDRSIELAVPEHSTHGGKTTTKSRHSFHAPSSNQPCATAILFLEKLPRSISTAAPTTASSSSASASHDKDDSADHTLDAAGRSLSSPEARKVQLRVHQARGLRRGTKSFEVVVTVRACGRHVGTTRVAAFAEPTSPQWVDEK